MTEREVEEKVTAVLALMKKGWICASMNEDGSWFAYDCTPFPDKEIGEWRSHGYDTHELWGFSIPKYPGNWTHSLVERKK